MAGHHPTKEGAGRATHLAWNHYELGQLLDDSPAVALVLSGHDHPGGYALGPRGTHFVTIEAMLEAAPLESGGNAYAVAEVRADRIDIVGAGSVTARRLAIKPWPGRPS